MLTTLYLLLNIDQETGEILNVAKIAISGPSLTLNDDAIDHLTPHYGFTDWEYYRGEEDEKFFGSIKALGSFNGRM